MRRSRMRVALVYGGRSAEHEVSLASARFVHENLDPARFEVLPILIDRSGRWRLSLPEAGQASPGSRVGVLPGAARGALRASGKREALDRVDLVFPLLHGPYGEDGSIQGLARLAGLPCVGADILGSAVGMDKETSKRLLREAGIPSAPFRAFSSAEAALAAFEEIEGELGKELFVKPCSLGSSVGVSRANSRESYAAALRIAFAYDRRVLVEKRIEGREIEVGLLGNEEPEASLPGEVILRKAFYDYESKYLDEEGALLSLPAELSAEEGLACRRRALAAYTALRARGMARVDLFLLPGGEVLVNEINTIPGFTKRSMFPRLWEASGLSPAALLERLVELALEDKESEDRLWRAPAFVGAGGEGGYEARLR